MTTLDVIMVGTVESFGPSGQTSAIKKRSVTGPIRIDENGIAGDEHAYAGHGGPDKVALHYAREHYPSWANAFPEATAFAAIAGISPGGADPQVTTDGDPARGSAPVGLFGENFSTIGMTEQSVCIGDRYRIGEVLLEVAGPRQPCGKLANRVGVPEIPERMQSDGTTGWYYRVVEPGMIEAGQSIELMDRPLPDWTVARIIYGLYSTPLDTEFLKAIQELGPLAAEFHRIAVARLESGEIEDWSGRMAMLK